MDLIIRRAVLPPGATPQHGNMVDIGIDAGRIVAVEPTLSATAREEIDADGSLVTPPFVDPHFHMDATLSYGLPRVNASGTLQRHRVVGRTEAGAYTVSARRTRAAILRLGRRAWTARNSQSR